MATIFRSSTDVFDWQINNCYECAKYGESMDSTSCELANSIEMACCGEREPPAEFFEPFGFENGVIPEQCSQLTPPTEEK